MAPVLLRYRVVAGRRTPEDTRPTVSSSKMVGEDGGISAYLHGSLQRGGLVLRSRPQGTSSMAAPHAQLSCTTSGHG